MKKTELNAVFGAVLSGDLENLRLAVGAGVDINARDRDGRTPLFQAVIAGKENLVRELIRSGCDLKAKDASGKTALHLAAIQGRTACVNLLIEAGSPVDERDKDGNTPLSDAVFYSRGKGDIIQPLLKRGANPDLPNKHGVSPKELAESIGNYDVAQFFR
jgi:ankyrin repeat protein